MARCNNDVLLKKIGINKLAESTEVEFTVLSDLPDCKKIRTDKAIKVSGDSAFDGYDRPVDRFECMSQGCVTSGTLTLAEADETALYRAQYDATEFAAGVVTFYVKAESYPTKVTVKLGSEEALTNADVYEVNVTEDMVADDGFAAVVVDLSKAPASTQGEGWTPSNTVVYIELSADKANTGFSSISILDSMEDFETNDMVVIGCLSENGGSFDIGALDATCWNSGYDTESLSFERTITGKSATSNYRKLNPLEGKGTEIEGWDKATVEKVVEAADGYGKVTLADMYQDECGFFAVQVADNCDAGMLTQLSIPTRVDVDAGHYQVIKNADGATEVVFNESLVGKTVRISYPKKSDIKEFKGCKNNIGKVRVRMAYTEEQTDGTKIRWIYDNVLVTSFPHTINTEESEFSFTVNIQPNADGCYYRRLEIVA